MEPNDIGWRSITIPPGKPTAHDALAAAGFASRRHNGADEMYGDEAQAVAAQIVIDEHDPLLPARERVIGLIKAEAGRRILERYPDWKQANMTARAVFLINKGIANLEPHEEASLLDMQGAWTWIEATRAFSNALEAEVAGMTDAMAINAIDPAAAAWPA